MFEGNLEIEETSVVGPCHGSDCRQNTQFSNRSAGLSKGINVRILICPTDSGEGEILSGALS